MLEINDNMTVSRYNNFKNTGDEKNAKKVKG
jgi:hypothetical protein